MQLSACGFSKKLIIRQKKISEIPFYQENVDESMLKYTTIARFTASLTFLPPRQFF
jgi:hypothetical protein